jgi:DNA repair exonuclease SbcCD ATPase subunit
MLARLGKLFVVLNAVAAVGLVTWAVTLTAGRLDWIDKDETYKATDENPYADDTHNLERLTTKVTRLNDAVKAAQQSLAGRGLALAVAEGNRDLRLAAHRVRLQGARTGYFFYQENAPNSGLLDVTSRVPDPKNPADAARIIRGLDNKPLQGLDAIQNEIKVAIENQSAYFKKSDELLKQYQALTGDMQKLDAEIDEQKAILLRAIAESKYLADRRTNWDEQILALSRRVKQLDDRMKEVLAAPAKASGVDKISSNVRP